jgi:CPA2 family monovalent cation:H+ antiporter-2
MGEVAASDFFNFFLYLLVPFAFGLLAKRLKMQPVVGYLLGGLFIGNFVPGILSKEVINVIANLGIILLLFMIGLEVNFEKILVFKKFIAIGGLLQLLLSIVFISFFSLFFGFTFIQALLIGIGLSSSSTILVAKILQEKGEESSFVGEIAIGVLMFQDLAFIPFIIIFNFLTGEPTAPLILVRNILVGTVQAVVILGLMYFLGRKIVPVIFDKVAKSSRELLDVFIILFIVFICYLSTLVGVPVLISAFVAGVLVGQTTEHYHIFSQLRPVRDIVAVIFFVFVGTHVPVANLLPSLFTIFSFSLVVLVVKFIIICGVFFYFRFNSRILFFLAILLFQIDEDAFILFSIAYAHHMFTFNQYIVLISTSILSLLVTPFFISNKEDIYFGLRKFFRRFLPAVELFIRHRLDTDPTVLDSLDIKNHVIICGYGRVGAHIGKALMNANIPFVSIDFNFHTVQKAKKEGVHIIYGDSTDRDILDYAEIEHAVALISVVPDKYSQEAIILNAKKLNPNIVIISRVHKHVHHQRLKDLGADIVIEPELEASLSIIKRIFYIKGLSPEERVRHLRHFKMEQGIS